MRRLAVALLAGTLVGSGAVAALASSRAPSVTVRQARLTEGTPKHPQGVKLSASLGWQANSAASQPTVTKLDVWFPGGTRYNGGSYPSCAYQRLNAAGPDACPKGSVMGSGTSTAYADTVVTRPKITVVNGGRDRVYFYTVLNNPARVQVPVIGYVTRLGGQFGSHLSATIPPSLRVVAGVPIKFISLNISAGRASWLAITAPPDGVKVVATFGSGSQIFAQVAVRDS